MSTTVGNRYLEGNYGPVREEVTVTDLPVEGRLPGSLQGRYIRTGPNPIVPPDPANHHWFVGSGMVHGVELRDGRASWYRNRWVLSPEVAGVKGVDEVPRPATGGLFAGSGNTNVVHHAGMILAINELSLPYELTPELDTIRQLDFGGPLPNGINAHPKFDPATGEMHVCAYSFAPPHLLYHVIDASGRLVRSEEIAVGGPVMVHDMAMTESSVVFFDLPVVFDLDAAMAGVSLPYRWDPDYAPRVGVLRKGAPGSDVGWCEVEPCYVFHPLNAYDDGDRLVLDVVRHPKMFAEHLNGPGEGPPSLDRWTIDPAAGKVLEERIDDRPQEFPRADERLAGRPHRYGYSVGLTHTGDGDFDFVENSVLKHDVVAGTTTVRPMGAGRAAGEVVFVPAGDDAAEDDGFLVGYVHDGSTGSSELLVLDAADLTAPPVAAVKLRQRVPFGFHGNWVPDHALS